MLQNSGIMTALCKYLQLVVDCSNQVTEGGNASQLRNWLCNGEDNPQKVTNLGLFIS